LATTTKTLERPNGNAVRPMWATYGYFGAFVALGLAAATMGPTLPGLAENTHTELSGISFLFMTRAAGYMLGSLLSGHLYDRMAGHPVMVGGLIAMAVTMVLVPVVPLLWLLAAILLVTGLAEGAIDVGGNTLLVWVHRSRVGPYMNGLHFFFGLGAFLTPIFIAQALLLTGDFKWAYWFLALLIIPIAVWLIRLPSPPAIKEPSSASPARSSNNFVAMLAALFMFLYVGAELAYAGWIYTYAVALDLATVTAAAYLTSVFWGSLTLGRLIGIPIAARWRPRTILLVDLVGSLASIGVILLWPSSSLVIWVASFGFGLFMASVFPTVITWAGRRMTMSGRITSWFLLGAATGAMTFPWLIGQVFEPFGPQSAMVITFVIVLGSLALFFLLMKIGGPPTDGEA